MSPVEDEDCANHGVVFENKGLPGGLGLWAGTLTSWISCSFSFSPLLSPRCDCLELAYEICALTGNGSVLATKFYPSKKFPLSVLPGLAVLMV
jgi:hypothetical protein